jgi:hypothetical protein
MWEEEEEERERIGRGRPSKFGLPGSFTVMPQDPSPHSLASGDPVDTSVSAERGTDGGCRCRAACEAKWRPGGRVFDGGSVFV